MTETATVTVRQSPLIVGSRLIILALVVFAIGFCFGHLTTQKLVSLPAASEGSLADAVSILRSNLTLLFVIGSCTGFQGLGRAEVAQGSRPWISWITTATICAFIMFNVWTAGMVIGQLGDAAVIRIAPHAPLEITAFGLGIAAFLKARVNQLTVQLAAILFGIATGLLVAGSLVETFVSGGLSS